MNKKKLDSCSVEKVLADKGIDRLYAYKYMRKAVLNRTCQIEDVLLIYQGNNIFEIDER